MEKVPVILSQDNKTFLIIKEYKLAMLNGHVQVAFYKICPQIVRYVMISLTLFVYLLHFM